MQSAGNHSPFQAPNGASLLCIESDDNHRNICKRTIGVKDVTKISKEVPRFHKKPAIGKVFFGTEKKELVKIVQLSKPPSQKGVKHLRENVPAQSKQKRHL